MVRLLDRLKVAATRLPALLVFVVLFSPTLLAASGGASPASGEADGFPYPLIARFDGQGWATFTILPENGTSAFMLNAHFHRDSAVFYGEFYPTSRSFFSPYAAYWPRYENTTVRTGDISAESDAHQQVLRLSWPTEAHESYVVYSDAPYMRSAAVAIGPGVQYLEVYLVEGSLHDVKTGTDGDLVYIRDFESSAFINAPYTPVDAVTLEGEHPMHRERPFYGQLSGARGDPLSTVEVADSEGHTRRCPCYFHHEDPGNYTARASGATLSGIIGWTWGGEPPAIP